MAVTLTINARPRDMGKFEKALGRNFRPMVIRITSEWGRYAVRALRRQTTKQNVMWKRRIYRGWVASRTNWHAMKVHNRADHLIFVEQGRRPGAKLPPDKPIREWVRSRLGDESLTFLIRRSIARKGIRAKPIITDGEVQKRMAAHMKRLLTRNMNAYMRTSARSV